MTQGANNTLSGSEQKRILDILEYWHKIEFFIPFDIDERIDDAESWRTLWLHAHTLRDSATILWRPNIPAEHTTTGFNLYLGIFDKSEIARICKRVVQADTNDTDAFEDTERCDIEGKSCFAKLKLNERGELIFDSVSVSTAPWALGQIQVHGLHALSYDSFENAKRRLVELLQNHRAGRPIPSSQPRETSAVPLQAAEVLALHQLFCGWAGYSPLDDSAVAVVEVFTSRKTLAKKKATALVHESSGPNAGDLGVGDSTDSIASEEDDEEETLEPDLDIINSFFTQDIERAIKTVRSGSIPRALAQYLTPIAPEHRIDLYSEVGRAAIFEALHPRRLNLGHWFDEPNQAMSLMQQFAINSALGSLHESGLFSVNGPPGTGKTTLLRDLFAENIVRRARVLASFNRATDAFDESGKTQIHFDGERKPTRVVRLKPALLGFEMVVASTNNAAVENISHDLPKTKSIGDSWRSQQYLRPVAHKVAAQTHDGSFRALSSSDMPWGLISCALGNSKNRRTFKERFAFDATAGHGAPPNSCGPEKPLSIRAWINGYQGPSFAEAVAAFKTADEEVKAKINRLIRYAELVADVVPRSEQTLLASEIENLNAATAWCRRAEAAAHNARRALANLVEQLEESKEDERLIDRAAPGWWVRLFRTTAAKAHAAEVRQSAAAQIAVRRQLSELKRRLADQLDPEFMQARAASTAALQALQQKRAMWASKTKELDQLRREFGHIKFPDALTDLETDSFQKEGLWHDENLARLRSTLFGAALVLHEAWLADVGKTGGPGFGGNITAITKMLSNKPFQDENHVALIWQSLFMIVPVVSTTFAAFARQLRGLGPGSIGWLFIDEAARVVPQAAVGALWRSKRAIVVGDPLQIEPVFTLPSKLIAALADLSPHTAGREYAPNKTSVQGLADAANRYGTNVYVDGTEAVWVGSPLRVHGRCVDPMFSLSNHIAYDGKMVFGLEARHRPDGPPIHCESAWIDIGGQVRRKQEVPQQTRFVVEMLVRIYARDRMLPSIYVISPFKGVKNELLHALTEADWTAGRSDVRSPKKGDLNRWCKEHLGTAHTFQGKQEDTVLMVLGADHEHAGAAQWAASKPNLLNVVLTRAKRRFYVVGDRRLWGSLPYFAHVARTLTPKTADEFLSAIGLCSSAIDSGASGLVGTRAAGV